MLITTDVAPGGAAGRHGDPRHAAAGAAGLLFLVSLCAPPFESARSALMADVLEGDRYAVATSLTNITLQLAQVVGFLAAGALVAVLDPSAALLIDAATFAVSALWLSAGLQRRPAPWPRPASGPRSLWQDAARRAAASSAARPRLLAIVGLLWVGTLFGYAWEGVAAPLVDELGSGATAHRRCCWPPTRSGVTVGGLVLARLVPPGRRERLVVPLVVLSLAPAAGRRAGGRPRRAGRVVVRRRGRPAVRVRASAPPG